MAGLQEQYDDALFEFAQGNLPTARAALEDILAADPGHFEARLALGMVFFRSGDLERAIAEGHLAEQLRPRDQMVHTNLSLFYVKTGNKVAAEHHGLQSRIASWQGGGGPAAPRPGANPDALPVAEPRRETLRIPERFPDQPWKKKKPAA